MGKLTSLKPALSVMRASRVHVPQGQREQDRHRDQSLAYRAWYKSARWRKLRLEVLARDGFVCQATGVLLVGKHPEPDSPVVDHRKPHRGDEALFWDKANLWSVSKVFHDGEKQRQEQRRR